MRFAIREATLWDAIELAGTMRQADRDELAAGSGRDVLQVLEDGIATSAECMVATTEDGQVVAMWGVVPAAPLSVLGPQCGVGWLLTSDQVDLYPLAFWRECKRQILDLLERWDILVNAIWAGHTRAVAWASRLGFQLHAAEESASGALFHPFHIDREVARV